MTPLSLPGRAAAEDPFRVPLPAVVSFSGGRSSAYMLARIVEAHGGRLPGEIHVVFANTGMERAETLDFVETCGAAWNVDIHWVEYDWDAPHRTRIVNRASAATRGEPYAALIERKGFVPSVNIRFCSGFLKRDRIESFARHRLGLKRWHAVIGLRADEPGRVRRMRARDCGSRTGGRAALPLADAGIRQADVQEWWKRQPFDLAIPSWAGNCDLCFLKARAKLLRIVRDEPERAEWWIDQEARVAHRAGPDGRACDSMKVFRLGESYEELRRAALDTPDLFDPSPAGETDDPSFECHCID